MRALRKLLRHTRVDIVLTRQRLNDGYSDDVITALTDNPVQSMPKIIVLLSYGTPPAVEARQVKIGADCVLRVASALFRAN